MLKLTKTGIGLLTKQYRSVLKKCLLLNSLALFTSINCFAQSILAIKTVYDSYTRSGSRISFADVLTSIDCSQINTAYQSYCHGPYFDLETFSADVVDGKYSYTKAQTDALLNYYYTFRVDKRDEVIEFTKELKGNEKEMSSLDFMPIKSSSDLQINLIKAEDPLTFSTKTRDDSLVLMEVCHA